MKEFKVDEEFIVKAHKAACKTWQIKIEEKFPEVFDMTKGGEWLINTAHNDCLVFYPILEEPKNPTVAVHKLSRFNDNPVIYDYKWFNTLRGRYRTPTYEEIIKRLTEAVLWKLTKD